MILKALNYLVPACLFNFIPSLSETHTHTHTHTHIYSLCFSQESEPLLAVRAMFCLASGLDRPHLG